MYLKRLCLQKEKKTWCFADVSLFLLGENFDSADWTGVFEQVQVLNKLLLCF